MQIKVRVIPNAARSEVVGWMDDVLKVKVQAVAEGGKANKALLELLAMKIGCRPREITICSGSKSRNKLVDLPTKTVPCDIFN